MFSSEYSKEELTEIITSVLESMHECREDVAVQWKGLVLLRKLTKNRIHLPLFYAPFCPSPPSAPVYWSNTIPFRERESIASTEGWGHHHHESTTKAPDARYDI